MSIPTSDSFCLITSHIRHWNAISLAFKIRAYNNFNNFYCFDLRLFQYVRSVLSSFHQEISFHSDLYTYRDKQITTLIYSTVKKIFFLIYYAESPVSQAPLTWSKNKQTRRSLMYRIITCWLPTMKIVIRALGW